MTITADSTVAVRDTLRLHFSTADDERISAWYIEYDDSWRCDSTDADSFPLVWEFPDTGVHRLVVHARAEDGRISKNDTLTVQVLSLLPSLSFAADSTAFINDTSVLRVSAVDDDGRIATLIWTKGPEVPRIVPFDTVVPVAWTPADTGEQLLTMYAVDIDGNQSAVDTVRVFVSAGAPVISTLAGDTVISVNDTARFSCIAADVNGTIAAYRWMQTDDTIIHGGGDTGSFARVWFPSDTGLHVIRVQAVDDDDQLSPVDSITIRVTANPPVIDSVVAAQATAGASSTITAGAHDVDGSIVTYLWTIVSRSGTVQMQTHDPVLSHTWTTDDIGPCTATVVAVDEDSLRSPNGTCTFVVHSTVPVLQKVSDTTIGSADTLRITRKTADSTQVVEQWYFDSDGGGWDDSGSADCAVYFRGNSRTAVVTGARNSDGAFFTDTFHVTFNLPPVLMSPDFSDGDTIWTHEGALPGTVAFPVSIVDPEGDFYTIQFLWGSKPDTVTGTDSLRISVDSIGHYAFTLTVFDAFGNAVTRAGTLAVGLEHTLCFAGHSIPVGVGDTTYQGGFRPLVLQALRDSLGPLERIRAIGPFTTNQVNMNPVDDSCFAIAGSFAREMLILMDHANTTLTADIWVLMLGVNGSFSAIETQATIDMMKRMATRNPHARIYVLTSQPFVSIPEVQRNYYNDHVRLGVDTLQDSGYAAFVVDVGDSTLYDEYTGEFNDTLSWDPVHPNIIGYRRMADHIVRVMRERDPQVLEWKNEE